MNPRPARGLRLPVIADPKRHGVINPGHISDDPIVQARYDALFSSVGPAAGLGPSVDIGAGARVWIDHTP